MGELMKVRERVRWAQPGAVGVRWAQPGAVGVRWAQPGAATTHLPLVAAAAAPC